MAKKSSITKAPVKRAKKTARKVTKKISKKAKPSLVGRATKTAQKVSKDLKKYQDKAHKELAKAKKSFIKHEKEIIAYAKKNPEKALAIAAGLGVAMASVAALLKKRK